MRTVIKIGYRHILLRPGVDVGEVVKLLDGATAVDSGLNIDRDDELEIKVIPDYMVKEEIISVRAD